MTRADARVEVVDENGRGLLPAQCRRHPLAVDGGGQLFRQFSVGGIGEIRAGGDQHAGGHLVVLGLADQIRGHMHGVRGVIGEDGDLGRAGLRVDADLRTADPLGRRDVDVSRSGDHVDRRQFGAVGVGAAVCQQRDRLRTADSPYLVDTQQPRRGEDRRVRQAAEVALRWAGDHQRIDTRGLRGHDVHHHAGRIDRVAARHVEADALDRHPALGHRGARSEGRGGIGTTLVGVDRTGAIDGYLERGADVGRQFVERGQQLTCRHPDLCGSHVVERFTELEGGLGAAGGHSIDDGPDLGHHRVDVHAAPGQG